MNVIPDSDDDILDIYDNCLTIDMSNLTIDETRQIKTMNLDNCGVFKQYNRSMCNLGNVLDTKFNN